MYIKYTLILCDIFSFEVSMYDVLLSLVLRISLDLVKEKKKEKFLRMNESCESFS